MQGICSSCSILILPALSVRFSQPLLYCIFLQYFTSSLKERIFVIPLKIKAEIGFSKQLCHFDSLILIQRCMFGETSKAMNSLKEESFDFFSDVLLTIPKKVEKHMKKINNY